MELFQKAKTVCLRSYHDKYLLADDDQETIWQDRNRSTKNAKWEVEILKDSNVIRFRSCYGKYLTATNMPFLFGVTCKKVQQSMPQNSDSSVEWEPIRKGCQVRLKSCYGQFLRANGGLPPWRNSITHDIPHTSATKDWILWDVVVVEFRPFVLKPPRRLQPITRPFNYSLPSHLSFSNLSSFARIELRSLDSDASLVQSGRSIYYNLIDENGDINDANLKCFIFKGNCVEDLRKRLEEETGLDDILVCCGNPLNGKLYPLHLQLPPSNADMKVFVVPSSFQW